jgi:hypothetical protein
MGNVRRRERGMEIGLNRKDPEKKKKGEADKGAPNGFFQSDEKEPSRQKPQKEQGKCGGRNGKFETAEIETEGVGEEYGNERKAERLTHLNPNKKRWKIGILEEWNIGKKAKKNNLATDFTGSKTHYSILPVFHHSSVLVYPLFHSSSFPLFRSVRF